MELIRFGTASYVEEFVIAASAAKVWALVWIRANYKAV
jgi:hypothetical protein